jgi:hypothetical protein
MIDIYTFVEAVWLMWPAYGANGLCMIVRGKRRIDFGRTFRGKPLFGAGKVKILDKGTYEIVNRKDWLFFRK